MISTGVFVTHFHANIKCRDFTKKKNIYMYVCLALWLVFDLRTAESVSTVWRESLNVFTGKVLGGRGEGSRSRDCRNLLKCWPENDWTNQSVRCREMGRALWEHTWLVKQVRLEAAWSCRHIHGLIYPTPCVLEPGTWEQLETRRDYRR